MQRKKTGRHIHDMRLITVNMDGKEQDIYKCASCDFKCTTRAIKLVRKDTASHYSVAKTNMVWDGPPRR